MDVFCSLGQFFAVFSENYSNYSKYSLLKILKSRIAKWGESSGGASL